VGPGLTPLVPPEAAAADVGPGLGPREPPAAPREEGRAVALLLPPGMGGR